jgi:tetratricopeptide (TPR) repeat protein
MRRSFMLNCMRVPILLLAPLALALFGPPLPAQTPAPEQLAQAVELLREDQPKGAIALLEPLVRNDGNVLNPDALGLAWNLLGSSYHDLQMFDKARKCYQRALEILRPLPSAQAKYAAAMGNLASLEDDTGQKDSSKLLWEKTTRIYESLHDSGGIAIGSINLAMLSYASKDFKAARRYLDTAEQQAQRGTRLRDDDTAALLSMQGAMAFHDGRYKEAMAPIEQAIFLYTRTHGDGFFMLGLAYALRAQVVAKEGNYTRAITDAQHALAIIDTAAGRNNTAYFQVEMVYAQILRASGDKAQAASLQKEASSSLARIESRQCSGCTMNVSAFR